MARKTNVGNAAAVVGVSDGSALHCASTQELIAEIRRRSLGCMVVCIRAEEDGDAWHYGLKGSPILLGAMSAALSLKTSQKLGEEGSARDEVGSAK
jgi:hypothetical protein